MASLSDVRCPRCGNEDAEFMDAKSNDPKPSTKVTCVECSYDGRFEEYREEYQRKHQPD